MGTVRVLALPITLACIVTAALLSCTQPTEPVATVYEAPVVAEEKPEETAPEVVEEPEPSSPEIPEDSEPAWMPEDGTLYLFIDEPGGELYHSETPTATRWASRVRAYRLTAEQYGYVFVAGRKIE